MARYFVFARKVPTFSHLIAMKFWFLQVAIVVYLGLSLFNIHIKNVRNTTPNANDN